MKKGWLIGLGCLGAIILAVAVLLTSVWGTYNSIIIQQQNVETKWAQVENVYQRRADLVPNLVATVKGYASHESSVLEAVTASRAQAGSIQMTPEMLNDPAAMQKFQQAQAGLSSALSRLLVVVEQYPNLKADQTFLTLQSQLEGTENRITVERMRFNEAAKEFNTYIRQFPKVILANMFGFREKPYFKAQEGADQVPEVKF